MDNDPQQESKSNSRFTIKLDSNTSVYHSVQYFICEKYIEQQSKSENFVELLLSTFEKTDDDFEIKYMLPLDTSIVIELDGEQITCKTEKISRDLTVHPRITFLYLLSLTASKKTVLDNLLMVAYNNNKKQTAKPVIKHYDTSNECWRKIGHVQERSEDTIILDSKIRSKLFDDIDKFTKNKQNYVKYGIPYKRNYLFYGRPGTGKSSLINVIASKTNRSVHILSFDASMTDSKFTGAIRSINNSANAILLLEDVDCIFHNRDSANNNSNISFSALLNMLDGVGCSTHGLMVFITTNYIEKLDKALLRPGRIDMMIKFDVISPEQINGILQSYNIVLDDPIMWQLTVLCQEKKIVPAILSGFIFRQYGDIELNNVNFIELFRLYLKEIAVVVAKNDYEELYI